MRDAAKTTSPLDGRAGVAGGGVAIAERPLLGKIVVRGDGFDREVQRAFEDICGTGAPTEPNTWTESETATVAWLGPDEWQVTTDLDAADTMAEGLRDKLVGHHIAVVEVSDYYVTIRVEGPRARDVLAKGTPLDLHPRVFAAGQCAQTLLAKASVLIVQTAEAPTYDLQVRWSMAEYLLDWLEDAAKPYL